jgi:hypothetical protein
VRPGASRVIDELFQEEMGPLNPFAFERRG